MTTIAQNLIKQLKQMLEMDFAATPASTFTVKLKDELLSHGFDAPTAEELAVSLEVEIPAGLVSHEELGELAKLYAKIIEKSWQNFRDNGFADPTQAMRHIAKKMTLKFTAD